METKQVSLSAKMHGPAKISVLLPDELKPILIVMVSFAAGIEVYNAAAGEISASYETAFILSTAGFALIYTMLQYILGLFAGEKASAVAVSASVFLLAVLLRSKKLTDMEDVQKEGISVGMLVILVYALWLAVKLLSERLYLDIILCVLADAVMIFLYFEGGALCADSFAGKLIYAVLFSLSASYIGQMFRYRNKNRYPFIYFLVVIILLLVVPSREAPINWKPVADAANRFVDKTKDVAWSVSYYLSDLGFGRAYYTGYSNLSQSGSSIHSSDKTEIELKTRDNTSFGYIDETSGKKLKRRRTVYLTGGRTIDHDQLLDILLSLYAHGIDSEQAALFLRTSDLEVNYVYLKTADEIIPVCAVRLQDNEGNTVVTSHKKHRKGYVIRTGYLDLDLGSPYLAGLIASPLTAVTKGSVSYKKMASYAYGICGLRLDEIIDEEEYAAWQRGDRSFDEYLDTKGATERMRKLASEITKGCMSDHEKSKAVEAYLRQYSYRTDTGIQGAQDTGSTEGMSRIADNFLFETGEGYCVHYASSMVMLLRLNGIPARYTTGYRYTFPFERQEKYEVSGSNAHAWPQAYISGFGWVDYEPTVYYTTAEERTWHRHPAASASSNNKNLYYTGTGNSPYPASAAPAVESPDNEGEEDETADTRMSDLVDVVKIVIIIISAVILTIASIIAGALSVKVIRYKKAGRECRVMMDVEDLTGIIRSVCGNMVKDRGVMSDYEPYIPDKYRAQVMEAFDIYYRIKYAYSNKSETPSTEERVTESEELRVRNLRNTMYDEYKRRFILLFH